MTAYSYTLATLRIEVRALLKEATASFWTNAQIDSYINDAISDISVKSGCYRSTVSVNTTTLTRLVLFTGYKCVAVEYNKVSLIKIYPLQAGHVKLNGVAPQYWFEFGSSIGIEPIPPGAYALTLYTLLAPATLVNEADVPDIPYTFCHLIIPYATSLALQEDAKYGAAKLIMDVYDNELTFVTMSIVPNIPDGEENLRFK